MAEDAPLTISNEGFTVLSNPENAKADIVFVHGLQGNPYSTWAHTIKSLDAKATSTRPQANRSRPRSRHWLSKWLNCGHVARDDVAGQGAHKRATTQCRSVVYWPKDHLAAEEWCNSARILTYGYDSIVTRGYTGTNKSNLFAHARDLLYNLEREKPLGRPVIFVVHSLGGIILKETLRRSEVAEEDNFKDIVRSTKGIVFLGTPHRGSPGLASLADAVRKVASIVTRIDSNSTLLRSLGTDSPELDIGRESFLVLWRKYNFQVKTFQEAHGLSGANVGLKNRKVVPDVSSSLDDPREHAETISANHMDMARFQGPSDYGYRKVSAAIRSMLVQSLQDTPLATARETTLTYNSGTNNSATVKTEKKVEDALLKSLYYSEMYDRQENISMALRKTVDWLFTVENYIAWADRTDVAQNHGLLWIKGKPGAGKSTLMKAAFLRTQSRHDATGISTAAFFFNARGTGSLEKTPIGLYRSLLYQMLQQDRDALPRLSADFEQKTKFRGEEVKWHREELQGFIEKVLLTPGSKPTTLFVDAMDECDDDEVRDIVSFFRRLTKTASQGGVSLSVCLSSRHYPQISIDGCPEIVVEDYNRQDILRFIETEAEDYSLIRDLQVDIADQSGGVFLWVVLVVSMLKKSGRGKSMKWLKSKLKETPPELDTLFRQLFSNVERDELLRTINLMHLILFADYSLDRDRLHVALSFSLHNYHSLTAWMDSVEFIESEKSRHEMIIELSKGLLEPTPASRGKRDISYQFIHETAREFFLSGKGFELLGLHTHSIHGSGHETLAWMCVRILETEEWRSLGGDIVKLQEYLGMDFITAGLKYAAFALFFHIEQAAIAGDFAEHILRYLQRIPRFVPRISRLYPGVIPSGADLLNAAAAMNLVHTVVKLRDMGFDINSRCNSMHRYPLLASLSDYNRYSETTSLEVFRWLLASGADVNVRNRAGSTALHRATAARYNKVCLVQEVLQYEPDIEARDGEGCSPLHWAARGCARESEHLVSMVPLISHGADVAAVDYRGNTALMHLDRYWLPLDAVRTLVEAGCPMNARNKAGDTLLHLIASDMAHFTLRRLEMVEVYNYLIRAGADPTIEDNRGVTAVEMILPLIEQIRDERRKGGEIPNPAAVGN